jgi:ketosteroid isomerase-like protein
MPAAEVDILDRQVVETTRPATRSKQFDERSLEMIFRQRIETHRPDSPTCVGLAVFCLVLTGVCCAQAQETTGKKAEEARKEILKLEDEKVAGLLRGGSEPADWVERYDADDIAQTNVDGSNPTKAQVVAGLQPGVFRAHSMKQDEHRIRVYDSGNVAVVTYRAVGVIERNGKSSDRRNRFTDVWVKQDGAWRRVVHEERDMPKQ